MIKKALEMKDEGRHFYGCYPALVTDLNDPNEQGRVKVQLPWSPDQAGDSYEAWARLATLMAGNNRGSWFMPDIGDEVLLMFEAGDSRRPIVVGALWNGQDAPPETMDSNSNNNIKSIVSRQGIRITVDDSAGQETLTLQTPQQSIVLTDGGSKIAIRDNNGNSMQMDSSGITVNSSVEVSVRSSTVNVSAGMVTVEAGMSRFRGVVQADTLIANSVVAASYTPGAGNIL